MNNNLIYIKDINNNTFDFNDMLESNKSIYINNCMNIKIIINNKINKITINKSNNIYLELNKLIVGIEINKSNNIILSLQHNSTIPLIELFRSQLFLLGMINKYNDIMINAEESQIHNILN